MMPLHLYSGQSRAGQRIGLLGGSFNPAHAGHRAVSLFALKRLGLDQVWWLISPQNPLKSLKDMAGPVLRLRGAQQIADHHAIVVTDIEQQLGTVYTIDTIRALQKRFPATHFVWLMGADNMQQIPRWQSWSDIFTAVPVAVFRRPAYAVGRRLGKAAQRFDKGWMPVCRSRQLADTMAPAWLVLDNPLNGLSATVLRRKKRQRIKTLTKKE